MAFNPVKPITASNATATNGSPTITVSGAVDCSKVFQGSILHLGGNNPVEAISGTTANASGQSTVTLRENWTEATQTAKLLIFNTIEGLVGAIQKAQNIVEQTSGIEAIGGTGLVEKTGDNTYTTATITTKGKQILLATTNQEVTNTLGLGTASSLDVTTSKTDTTAGRVLKVGDFGIGATDTTLLIGSVDQTNIASGTYRVTDLNTGTKPPFEDFIMVVSRYNSQDSSQMAIRPQDRTVWFRVSTVGVFSSWVKIHKTGDDVVIGTTALNGLATFNKTGDDGRVAEFRKSATLVGSIALTGTTTTYNTTSDYRLKEDIRPILNPSERVLNLKPINHAWKKDGTRTDGFLAHQFAEECPQGVSGEYNKVDDKGEIIPQTMDASKAIPLLTASLQDALQRITLLEKELISIKER